jgi:uncharacterized protein
MPKFPVKPDASSEAFFDGASRGEFLIVKDTHSGDFLEPQFDISIDTARYRQVPASGRGRVVSWAVVHERTADGDVRRPVGVVELDEGPWWWTELVDAKPDADLMGLRVRVDFQTFDDGSSVPYFRPDTTPPTFSTESPNEHRRADS